MQDTGGQQVQAEETEAGGRAFVAADSEWPAVVRRASGTGFEDGRLQAALAGDLVAVVAEALAEVVQLGIGDVAHVAVESVFPGEGRDGHHALAKGQGEHGAGERDW